MTQWFNDNGKNNWLDREMNHLKREIQESKKEKNSKKDMQTMKRFLWLLIPSLFLAFTLSPIQGQEKCKGIKGVFFPDTWICRNCGYENYEGVPCAICGSSQK